MTKKNIIFSSICIFITSLIIGFVLIFYPIFFPGRALSNQESPVEDYDYINLNYNPLNPKFASIDKIQDDDGGRNVFIIQSKRTGIFKTNADENDFRLFYVTPETNDSISKIKYKLKRGDYSGWDEPYVNQFEENYVNQNNQIETINDKLCYKPKTNVNQDLTSIKLKDYITELNPKTYRKLKEKLTGDGFVNGLHRYTISDGLYVGITYQEDPEKNRDTPIQKVELVKEDCSREILLDYSNNP